MNGVSSSLPGHVEAALAAHGVRPVGVSLLSPLRERKGVRMAWRVACADGQTLKLRDFGEESEARRVFDLLRRLEPGFVPALARYGAALIEAWIEGEPFAAHVSPERFEEAGALLGRLHLMPPGPMVLPTGPTRGWIERAGSDMETLVDAHKLTRVDADALGEELARRDPGSCANTIIHTDFCADNILVDSSGALRVIDNEHLTVGPAGFDLGCSYHRWPMSGTERQSFRRGYRAAAPEPSGMPFWRIAASLRCARVNLEYDPTRLDTSLAVLRRFAAGEGLADD